MPIDPITPSKRDEKVQREPKKIEAMREKLAPYTQSITMTEELKKELLDSLKRRESRKTEQHIAVDPSIKYNPSEEVQKTKEQLEAQSSQVEGQVIKALPPETLEKMKGSVILGKEIKNKKK